MNLMASGEARKPARRSSTIHSQGAVFVVIGDLSPHLDPLKWDLTGQVGLDSSRAVVSISKGDELHRLGHFYLDPDKFEGLVVLEVAEPREVERGLPPFEVADDDETDETRQTCARDGFREQAPKDAGAGGALDVDVVKADELSKESIDLII